MAKYQSQRKGETMKRCISLLLAAALLLSLAACGNGGGTAGPSGAAAAAMRLKRAEGTVAVADETDTMLEPVPGLGLYDGYAVDTKAQSCAWIELDAVKLTKLDENSGIGIHKEGKALEIEIKSGSVFFNVTEPLANDETLNICSSTMLVGIRGTCGWVTLSGDTSTLTVYLLEGAVECSNGNNIATVSAGEKGMIPVAGEITVSPFFAQNVPAFVQAEIEEDAALAQAVETASGIDVRSPIDPIRLRDLYTYSKVYIYTSDGTLRSETEYFPDEQGRVATLVNYNFSTGVETVSERIYNDDGTPSMLSGHTVTENTADHRKTESTFDNGHHNENIAYFDEQGRETERRKFTDGELTFYYLYTYDANGRLIRCDEYSAQDDSLHGYYLYEYD